MSRRIKSRQLRLTVELGALFLAASCLALGGLIYSASLTAGSVADRELVLRAEDIARYVSLDESKKPRLDLPPGVQQAYSAAAQQSAFAIRDRDGQLIAARDRRDRCPMAAGGFRTELLPGRQFRALHARIFRRDDSAQKRGWSVIGNGRRSVRRRPAGSLHFA